MSRYKSVKILKIIYILQACLGFLNTVFVTVMVGVMSTDSPTHTTQFVFLSTILTFVIVFLISVIIPLLSLNELNTMPKKRKILFNTLNTLLLFITFLPAALLQIYLLVGLNKKS